MMGEVTCYCPNCGKKQVPLEYKSKVSETDRFYSKFVLKCSCNATSFVRMYSIDRKLEFKDV